MTEVRPIDLRSDAGKALLRLTREQFEFWREQLEANAKGEFAASHSLHFWFILSAIALEGDEQFRLIKKRAEEALPQCNWETGRRYLQKCQELELVETITTGRQRYVHLTESGQRAIAMTLGRWTKEFGALQRNTRHAKNGEDPAAPTADGDAAT